MKNTARVPERKRRSGGPVARKAFLFAVLLCFFLAPPERVRAAEEGRLAGSPVIRVELFSQAGQVDFSVSGNYRLKDAAGGKTVAGPLPPQERWRVRTEGGRLAVYREGRPVGTCAGPLVIQSSAYRLAVQSGSGAVVERTSGEGLFAAGAGGRIRPLGEDLSGLYAAGAGGVSAARPTGGLHLVTLDGGGGSSRYRGSVEIRAGEKGLTAVNLLPLEEYLYGVVPAEMPAGWPPEALKAQAVASRSYALVQIRKNSSSSPFDLLATQASQVYRGYDQETPATNGAVDETRGVVLTWQGAPAEAYFHSSSGGFTENSEDVWKNRLDYIRARPDPFDLNDQHYNWQVSYTKEELIKQLASKGYKFRDIFDLAEKERTSTGKRVKRLLVSGLSETGAPLTVEIGNANEVRTALGLKSAFFTLEKELDARQKLVRVTLRGNGSGHGLGMSQYGALGMARKGYSYQDILKYYYSGITISTGYGGQE